MKSLTIPRHGGPEVFELREAPDPRPADGEVRVRVARAGVNFSDVVTRIGLNADAPKPPCVVGYEVAGTVDEVGAGVGSVSVGDRVLAIVPSGGYSDTVVAPEGNVFRLRDGMDFDAAAALPVVYLTAYHAVFHVHALRPRSRVLVHMAGGGLGRAVIELCRTVEGVELFGTASAAKHETLRGWGVHHPIDYRSVDYAEEVRRITEGRGVDLIIDPLGGPDTAKNYELLAPAGHLVLCGWSNMVSGKRRNYGRILVQLTRMKRFSALSLLNGNRTVSGINMARMWGEAALLRGHLLRLLELHAAGRIAPWVDKVFPLSEGADAHRYLQDRKNVGKVVLDCAK